MEKVEPMKPSIKLIEGTHITAADKRTILQVIEHLREIVPQSGDPDYLKQGFLGLDKSRKSYAIQPSPANDGIYSVMIKDRQKDDWGRMNPRTTIVTIQSIGVAPLHMDPNPEWVERMQVNNWAQKLYEKAGAVLSSGEARNDQAAMQF